MRRLSFINVIVFALVVIGFGCSSTSDTGSPAVKKDAEQVKQVVSVPPKAEKIKKELTIHGDTRIDNYFWLNQREEPKVLAYLKAENDYLDAAMKHTEVMQKELYKEMTGRIKQEDRSVPYKKKGYQYYTRFEKGKEYAIHCRKKDLPDALEEILLDENRMAVGHEYFRIDNNFSISPDNAMIAYGVDTVSRRKYTINIKNLFTKQTLTDTIPNTDGRPEWGNDNKIIYYVAKDDTLRTYKVFSHVIGAPVSEDKELYHEADETFNLNLFKTNSGKYLILEASSTLSSDSRYLDLTQPGSQFKLIEPRMKDYEYSVEHVSDKWILRTNYKAKNYRLMETLIAKGSKENWQELIPNREDTLLGDFEVFKNHLALQEQNGGLPKIRVMDWDNKGDHYIEFKQPTYDTGFSKHQEFDSEYLRYTFSSLAVPDSTYRYNMKSKENKLLKQDEIADFDPNNYVTEWIWAPAKDGTKVPVSLFYRKGLKKDGNNPMLLYAYGSYGYSSAADFDLERISLVDRGFVYAIAHIRGGQEMGRYWYEEGKLLKKINTFTDFIDCAKFLVAEKFTNPSKLSAQGGSAGGLLMGAVLNMQSDLFRAVVAQVPFVDVVTTMLDKSIPLTTSEYDEWGNPEQKKYYDYMLSYSPYDHVTAKDYPAILVTTGLHDSQVQYWEPAKWVAKLRDMKTDKNLLILSTNMSGGHGGASGRFRRYIEISLGYAFIIDQLGQKE
jgi:oligopeptidase B